MYAVDDSQRTFAMKEEISAAVMFLIRLIGKSENLSNSKLDELKKCLTSILMKRFQDHWFPDKPFKGQAYRCIRINETERRDPILQQAADECGLKYEDFKLPSELTIWVDPEEVCCRFGEFKGSYCIVASFKDGNKENFVDQINVDELEQKALEKARQATFEIMSGHRGWKKKSLGGRLRNGYSNNSSSHGNHLYHPLQLHNVQHPSYPYPNPLSTQYQPQQQLSPVYSSSPPSHYFYSSSPPHHSQPQPAYAHSGHLTLTPPHAAAYRYGKGFSRGSGSHFPNGYERSSPSCPSFVTNGGPIQTSASKNDRYHWMNNKSTIKA